MVKRLADPMFMNFCLRKENGGVDLLMTVDEGFVGVERAGRYLGCLGEVLGRVLGEGEGEGGGAGWLGLDLSVGELVGGLKGDVSKVVVGREMVLWGEGE